MQLLKTMMSFQHIQSVIHHTHAVQLRTTVNALEFQDYRGFGEELEAFNVILFITFIHYLPASPMSGGLMQQDLACPVVRTHLPSAVCVQNDKLSVFGGNSEYPRSWPEPQKAERSPWQYLIQSLFISITSQFTPVEYHTIISSN